MKKNLLHIALLIMFATGFAQTPLQTFRFHISSTSTDMPGGIVRSWNATNAVVYVSDGTNDYFAVVNDPTLAVNAVRLPTDYKILDFKILDDYLFFCGSVNNKGLIGCLKVSDIMSVYRIDYSYKIMDSLTSIKKLAPYISPATNAYRVAAVGESWETTLVKTYLIDAECSPRHIDFQISPCYVSSDSVYWEKLFDVVATDNYIAYVGIITNNVNTSIRVGPKSGVLTSPSINIVYTYAIPNNGVPVAEALDGDNIAVVSECVEAPDVVDEVQLRMYDLTTLTMYAAQMMRVPYKGAVNDLAYMHSTNTLLMTYEEYAPAAPTYYVLYLQPTSTPPYIAQTVSTPDNVPFYNIDVHNTNYFLLNGGSGVIEHHAPSLSPSDLCISLDTRAISKLDLVDYMKIEHNVTLHNDSGTQSRVLDSAPYVVTDCITF